jgi:hypothetical protein
VIVIGKDDRLPAIARKKALDVPPAGGPALIKLNWRLPICGGLPAHGSDGCGYDSNNIWKCICQVKPINNNFELGMALGVAVRSYYPDRKRKDQPIFKSRNAKEWNAFAIFLFSNAPFSRFLPITGDTLKTKCDDKMNEVKKRHDLGTHASGFETHPEISNYDKICQKKKEASITTLRIARRQ